jgi:hypothetical protein
MSGGYGGNSVGYGQDFARPQSFGNQAMGSSMGQPDASAFNSAFGQRPPQMSTNMPGLGPMVGSPASDYGQAPGTGGMDPAMAPSPTMGGNFGQPAPGGTFSGPGSFTPYKMDSGEMLFSPPTFYQNPAAQAPVYGTGPNDMAPPGAMASGTPPLNGPSTGPVGLPKQPPLNGPSTGPVGLPEWMMGNQYNPYNRG